MAKDRSKQGRIKTIDQVRSLNEKFDKFSGGGRGTNEAASKQTRYQGPRFKQMTLDIEVTGLRSEQIYNADILAWKSEMGQFWKNTTHLNPAQKLEQARRLNFYKYFEPAGLAQLAVQGGPFSRNSLYSRVLQHRQGGKGFTGPLGQDVGIHGYTIWSNRLNTTAYELLNPVGTRISQFSMDKGIIDRALSAWNRNEAMTELESVAEFIRTIQNTKTNGSPLQLLGHNIGFDILGIQSFAVRHGEELLKMGLDPFAIANKYWSGDLVLNASEDFFFDLLRAKGLRDNEWAKKFLKFGKFSESIFPEIPGVAPGVAIEGKWLLEDARRVKQGETSFLRAKAGWKLEILTQHFTRYMNLNEETLGVPYHLFQQLNAHDALYDVAITNALGRRFGRAAKLWKAFENLHSINSRRPRASLSHFNKLNPKHLEAIAMARSGFLGDELMGAGIRGLPDYTSWFLQDPDRMGLALTRTEFLWDSWTRGTSKSLKEVEYLSSVLKKSARRIPLAERIDRRIASAVFTSKTAGGRVGLIAAGVGLLAAGWLAFGRKNDKEYNLPPNYVRGMQGNSRGVNVPWHSPYHGPDLNLNQAQDFMDNAGGPTMWGIKHAIGLGALYGAYNVWGVLTPQDRRKYLYSVYKGARFFEDVLPFRIGRIAEFSSKLSSFMAPETIDIATKHLLEGTRLSQIGRVYARGLNVEHEKLAEYLVALNNHGIKLQATRKGYSGVHTISFNDEVAKGTALFGTRRTAKFYAAATRRGRTFAIYGMDDVEIASKIKNWQAQARLRNSLAPGLGEGPLKGFFKSIGRWGVGKSKRVENFLTKKYLVPAWDIDPVNRMYRRIPGLGQLYIPAYESVRSVSGRLAQGQFDALRGLQRWLGGSVFDWYRSSWGLVRQRTANLGFDIGPAPTLGKFLRKTTKVGLAAGAAMWGFSTLNDIMHGWLTRPLWNIQDRIQIAHAKISDRLGLTDLRKHHPLVGKGAALAWFALPWVSVGIGNYLQRVKHLPNEINRQTSLFKATGRLDWETGATKAITEYYFSRRRNLLSFRSSPVGLKVLGLFSKRGDLEVGIPWLNKSIKIFKGRRPNAAGWIAGAIWLGASALFSPFLFGSKYTAEEKRDILTGKRKAEIRKGRWWEFGSTPYEGGRSYFRLHQSARAKLRLDQAAPEENRGLWARIKDIVTPYWREKAAFYTRPYPITGVPFQNIPIVGGLLGATIGRFIKPQLRMHTDEWKAGQGYLPYGSDVEPSAKLGGLAPVRPSNPLGWRGMVRDLGYRATEFMGLRGFILQSTWFKSLWGSQAPYGNHPFLAQSAFGGGGLVKRFYQAELGGMGGFNELLRRFFPRPEPGNEINPLRNQMPSWMPGNNYMMDFHKGDPYSKVPYGSERLPGAGFEKLHPSLQGIDPEKYPDWARMEILGDVAPWSQEYRTARGKAYKQAKGNPQMIAYLQQIEEQRDIMVERKRFAELSYREKTENISGHVSEITGDGKFRLSEYPNHIFTIGGANLRLNNVADHLRSINGWTKEKAVEAAYNQESDRQAFLERLMAGEVNLKIHRGGLNSPTVTAEVFSGHTPIARALVDEGYAAPEAGRYQSGFLGRAYGKAVEFVGHLPQHIPGPFFLHTKLANMATAQEQYKRDILYGTDFRSWDKPWENFARPYIYGAIQKLTPGNFVPPHVQKRWEMDTLYDRMAYLKALKNNDMRSAVLTMAGADVSGQPSSVKAALPYRERPYFEAFVQETDPTQRSKIIGMVSPDMQRALTGQWWRQLAQAEGVAQPSSRTSTQQNAEMARSDIRSLGYSVPSPNWIGWNKSVDIQDVQAVHIQHEGMNSHDFNIWDDRLETLSRKPYLAGSHKELISQSMDISSSILSRNIDNTTGFAGEHISHRRVAQVNVYHDVDHRDREDSFFRRFMDNIR